MPGNQFLHLETGAKMVAFWLLATLLGEGGRARALARQRAEHVAFAWLWGGLSIN